MTLPIAFTPEAQADIEEVHAWYAARGARLAEEFRGALDQCLEGVATFPEASPLVHRSVRRVLLRRFPFCVFYVVEREREIEVINPGRLETDPSARLAAGQQPHQLRVTVGVIVERHALGLAQDRHHDLPRAHINPDASCSLHAPSVS